MQHIRSFDAACFRILAISLNSYTISSKSSMFEVNWIVQLLQSWAFSRQIIITQVKSSVVADKNVKLSTIFFSCWNDSWCKIERACDCWLSFELLRNWFSMYKRVTIFIKLSWYVLLNIALFMMMILNYCVISINRLNQRWSKCISWERCFESAKKSEIDKKLRAQCWLTQRD